EGSLEAMRLQKLLELREGFPPRAVAARVIDRNRSSLFKTLLINKGTADGLRVGLAVLSDQGVVGRIIETSWHASRVLLLIDGNSNIDGLIQRSRAQGILQGAGSAGCSLKYISRAEEVLAGDVVISSGLSGVLPKGLLLGVVTGASRKEGGLFQKIDVAPAVDFEKLEEVLALTTDMKPKP
ncbi:MAG: rod shape-determining protein MreC, partial [Thermodesulfobacteriota bacterium]